MKPFAALSLLALLVSIAIAQENGSPSKAAGVKPTPQTESKMNMFDWLSGSPVHTIFTEFIREAKLEGMFSDKKDITVFAPTDAGFLTTLRDMRYRRAGNPQAVLQFFKELVDKQKEQLNMTRIILFHVTGERMTLKQIMPKGAIYATRFMRTQSGDLIEFKEGTLLDSAKFFPNPAFNPPIDINASNGVVHAVNRVLLPNDIDRKKMTLAVTELQKTYTPISRRNMENEKTSLKGRCFPLSSTVRIADGATVAMGDLAAGHHIHASEAGDASAVFLFSHRTLTGSYEFVRMTTMSGHSVAMSPGHYVYANGKLKAASAVRIGDLLRTVDGQSRVVAIDMVRERGLVAPHTIHGDIVVDGIVASSYTTAVHPRLAQMMLAPVRAVVRLGLATEPLGSALYNGADGIVRFLPNGPNHY